MRKTTFIALVAVAAVAAGAAIALSMGRDGGGSAGRSGERFLPEVTSRANDVREVVLVRHDGTATLKQDGDRWIFVERADYPANGEQIRRVIVELADLRLVEPKTRKSDLYGRLQVEEPTGKDARSTAMTLKDGQGKVIAEAVIGRRRIDRLGGGRDSMYVRRKGEAQAWLAAGNVDIAGEYQRFLIRPLVDLPAERFAEAKTIQPDGAVLVARRATPEGKMEVVDLPEGKTVKEDDRLRRMGSAFVNLDIDDVKKRGEANIPDVAVKAEFRTFDGIVIKAATHETNSRAWARFTVETTPEATDDAKKEAATLKTKLEPYDFELLGFKTAPMTTKLSDLIGGTS